MRCLTVLAPATLAIVFGWLAPVDNFRLALLASSFLALAAAFFIGLTALKTRRRLE